MRRLTPLLAMCLLTLVSSRVGLAQDEKPAEEEKPYDTTLDVESFDKVWTIVKERHWDTDSVGESWDKAKEELRPKVAAAKSKSEARKVMFELIGRLKQSHFSIVAAQAYEEVKDMDTSAGAGGSGYAGLVMRERGEKLLVTEIRKDSPAAASAIKPGWVITKFGNRKPEELFELADKVTKTGPMTRATFVGMNSDTGQRGPIGKVIKLECIDLEGEPQTVELKLTKAPGNRVRLGTMPSMQVEIRTDILEGKVGYFAFSSFFDPVRLITTYDKLLKESEGGLIIDVRGNPGGLMTIPTALGARLNDKSAKLGVVTMKAGELKMVLNTWPKPFKKPVAVLIDECSVSCSEILSGGLKDLKLARVFGTRTAGLVLPSSFERLPNGDGFQFAFADYHSESGEKLEGKGVTPDEEIALTTEAFKKHEDPVLARALEWIKSETESN